MRGVSAQSLDAVLSRAGSAVEGVPDPKSIAHELFATVAAIDSSNQLVRALTDFGRDGDFKASVVNSLFADKVAPETLAVLDEAARKRWSEQNHLLQAIELAGVYTLLQLAEREGAFDTVESELFQFARMVEDTPELSEAFDATRDRTDQRVALVTSLLEGKAHPVTVLIAEQAVRFDTMIKVPSRLDSFAEFASSRRARKIGVVTSAVALTAQQQERLGRILTEKYGSGISLNFDIDPNVLGGMHVAIGDDLFDATIAGRVKQAREQLTA